MEPTITTVVTALALGASAGVKDSAAKAVKDAYSALKEVIQHKYQTASVPSLENAPDSHSSRAVVEEALSNAGAEHDPELLGLARSLLDAIQEHAPEACDAIGVDLEHIRAASLRISEVLSSGTGVKVNDAALEGEISISGIRAGQRVELVEHPPKV
jgi:hypothetical protein